MYNKFKKLEDQEDEEELVKKQKKETKDKKKKKKPSKAEKSDDEEENLDDYQPKSSVNKRKREKRQKRRAEMNVSSDSDNDDSKGKAPKKKEPIPDIIVVGAPDPSKDEKTEAVKDKDSNKKDSAKESKKDNDEDIEDEEEKDSVISINDLDDFDVDDSRKKSKKRKNDDDDGSGDGKKKKKKKSRRSKLAEKLGFKKEEEPDRPLTFGEKVDKFFTLSGETRFIGFGILFGFGLIGILASFIFLEEIIDEPAPFCILYCLGFLFLIASTFFLLGPCRQIRHLMKPCRFICAAVFLITLILTLVMAIAVEEPTLTIVSLVIQFVAFGLYLISLCPCIQKCCSGMCSLLV